MRRLDEVRDRRIPAEQAVRECQKKVAELQEDIWQPGLLGTAWAQTEMKQRQADLADANATLLRLRNEETKLLQDIATEQDRWAEINQRLEDLDRSLARR